jgi:hypothetical protein
MYALTRANGFVFAAFGANFLLEEWLSLALQGTSEKRFIPMVILITHQRTCCEQDQPAHRCCTAIEFGTESRSYLGEMSELSKHGVRNNGVRNKSEK